MSTGWNLYLDGWIIVIAVTCGLACALPGCFLLLRRMSLMGDALSHAVLPGIAVGFILTHSRANIVMFLGAVAAGLLTAYFTQWLRRYGRVESGAAMGVVFTTLFALGLILIVRGADSVDLHAECVLYGDLESALLDTVTLFGFDIPRAFLILAAILVINILIVLGLLKELRLAAFDPELADTLGFRSNLLHYLLMTMTAITTVAAFESVGSIIVVAMLVVPAATAKLLATRLSNMILIACGVAVISGVLGHIGAVLLPRAIGYASTQTSGMMASVSGVLLLAAVLFAPHDGLVARISRRVAFHMRTIEEDLLALTWRLEENGICPGNNQLRDQLCTATGARSIAARYALHALARRGEMTGEADHIHLTEKGRTRARELVRAHRLWEAWLEQRLGLSADHVHETAMRLEHVTDPSMRRRLSEETGAPSLDPHGRSIPD